MERLFIVLGLTLALGGFLSGCSDTYRYPCQDPTNWDKDFCKKPVCSANGTCPEDLKHYEKDKPGATPAPQTTTQGVCK